MRRFLRSAASLRLAAVPSTRPETISTAARRLPTPQLAAATLPYRVPKPRRASTTVEQQNIVAMVAGAIAHGVRSQRADKSLGGCKHVGKGDLAFA
jgi:hypothetical protein